MSDDVHVIGGPGHGQLAALLGVPVPIMDTLQPAFPEGHPIDVLLLPTGAIASVSSARVPRGTLIMLLPLEISNQIRAQFKPRVVPVAGAPDEEVRIGEVRLGAGHGTLTSVQGFDIDAIDTGSEGFPQGAIDVMLVVPDSPRTSGAQLPRGCIVAFVPPHLAGFVRAQFKPRPTPRLVQ